MLVHHLAKYAAYHRDQRNVATHMVGIPLIVLAVAILLSRPAWTLGTVPLTPAMVVALAAAAFYLRLDAMFGLLMAVLLALACWAGLQMAAQPTPVWLGGALGAFVFGWIIQFVGHAFEGRKPAFLDDLRGLLIGPLFVVAELVFALGGRSGVRSAVAVEQRRF